VSPLIALAGFSLLAWLVLLGARGGFWLTRERLDDPPAPRAGLWPAVAAVVPARNEAAFIGESLASLLDQDYPGELSIVLVDDGSSDGTARVAAETAAARSAAGRLAIVRGEPLPTGWVGKVWAMAQGVEAARTAAPAADLLWFTDADILHDPQNLRRLVAKAETEGRDLVSLMVLLRCVTVWERLLIPPFVFFFRKLYPFAWVNDPHRGTAAAAGGCVLLRRSVLEGTGGLHRIRDTLIDDCALARLVKREGGEGRPSSLWLGLTRWARSLRGYDDLRGIWAMVARSAYAQLGHSPIMLGATVLGMGLIYLVPALVALTIPLHGNGTAALLAALAWALMAGAIAPTLRLYGQPLVLAILLPAAAFLYVLMTLDSARAHRLGRGGAWKGRVAGAARSAPPSS
jgi:hopene-associated glycosyltransferase HpnB